jgi:hypothetical protein
LHRSALAWCSAALRTLRHLGGLLGAASALPIRQISGTMRDSHVFCVAIALAAILFSAESAAATEYYVSASGSDSNNGTSLDAPFLTIQKAAGLTNPGDTVYVTNGTYGPLSITRSGSASGGYIAYQAYPGHHPTINKTGNFWSAVQIKKKTEPPISLSTDSISWVTPRKLP